MLPQLVWKMGPNISQFGRHPFSFLFSNTSALISLNLAVVMYY